MTCVESVRLSAGIRVGDRFSKAAAFTSDSIREFATLVGDTNPLHHDDNAAAEFGGVIASGIHTFSAVFAAVLDFLPKESKYRSGSVCEDVAACQSWRRCTD